MNIMNRIKLLEDNIGSVLQDGLVQSFELEGSIVDEINATFLKFNTWIKIVSSEGETTVSNEMSNIKNITEIGDDTFRYRISQIQDKFPEFKKYIGRKLIGIKEFISRKNSDLSFGLNLFFEDDLNLIIHNVSYSEDRTEYIFQNKIPLDLEEK